MSNPLDPASDAPTLAVNTSFTVNGRQVSVAVDPDTPLLWVIRDEIGLKGTKIGRAHV